MTSGGIARRLSLATPAVTRATARMEVVGLLRRAADEHDRGLVRILLTKPGKALEKVIGREIDRLSERALASLEPAAQVALVDSLNRVRRNLTLARNSKTGTGASAGFPADDSRTSRQGYSARLRRFAADTTDRDAMRGGHRTQRRQLARVRRKLGRGRMLLIAMGYREHLSRSPGKRDLPRVCLHRLLYYSSALFNKTRHESSQFVRQ